MPSRRPTMTDVAARAGVSLKTVSRVVNDERHVSAPVRDRVQQAIAELAYRPDRRARELAATGSAGRLIGFVQTDAANPFFASVNRGLEDTTRARGLTVITGSTDGEPAREEALVRTMVEFRVDGLVVVAAEGSNAVLLEEIARGMPVVCVDRVLPGDPCDVVVSDNRASTAAAVRHLIGLGHRRVAFLGGNQLVWTAAQRMAGYSEALRTSGVARDPRLVAVDVDAIDAAAQATHRLLALPAPPTALFTAQDRITTGALTALHALGRQQDIALIGYDDIPFAEQLDPTVSAIAQDPYAMGCRAGQLLLDRLSRHPVAAPRRVVLDAPLRHRASGALRPGVALR